jgi:hypothetical protein
MAGRGIEEGQVTASAQDDNPTNKKAAKGPPSVFNVGKSSLVINGMHSLVRLWVALCEFETHTRP